MRRPVLLLFSVLMLCGLSCAAQDTFNNVQCCRSFYTAGRWDTLDLHRLGQEYKRLKSLKCSDCDHFSSDLMRIMEVLGTRLEGSRKCQVRKIMGKADEKEGRQYIYHWRNRHDYLYFTGEKHSRTVKHGWYYAYE
ncbi:MAG: hypothetical protein JNL13_03135 [Chitinophagaceae bacterium]|nr:hypothetical protein [Chitinophagaceae bacterium]